MNDAKRSAGIFCAQRVFDAAAVERGDALELVERDRHAAPTAFGDASGERKDLLGEVRDVAVGADGGEGHRNLAAAGLVRLDAHFRPYAREHLAQPRPGPLQLGFGRRQRARVALEERDVGAVAADLDFDGQRATSSRTLQGLADQ